MKTALNIIRICLSVILCIVIAVSLFSATAVKATREYLGSEELYQQIESADIGTVKFTVNGKTAAVSDLVSGYIEQYTDNDLFPFGYSVIDWAVNSVLSSDKLNEEVKKELFNEIDYLLNSDRGDALKRLKGETDTEENIQIDWLDPSSIENAVKTYIKNIIIGNIENATGVSSDLMIVILSEKNVTYLLIIALAAFLILIAVNIHKIPYLLAFSGVSSLFFGLSLKFVQIKFASFGTGKEDLFVYKLLSPLANGLSPYALSGIIVGAVLILVFAASVILIRILHRRSE